MTDSEKGSGGKSEYVDPVEELIGETELEFQCGVAANDEFEEGDPEYCSHEPETIELDEPAWQDDQGLIVLSGRPKDCPECGNPVGFRFNGVEVAFP